MGTWNTGAFDNDTALDLLAGFEDEGPQALRRVFDQWAAQDAGAGAQPRSFLNQLFGRKAPEPASNAPQSDSIDADLAMETLAAGEIIAAAHGSPGEKRFVGGVHDDLAAQLEPHAGAVRADAGLLTAAQARINGDLVDPERSELAALWSEADGADDAAFRAGVIDLAARLARLSGETR